MSQGWTLKRIEHEAHKRKWGGFEDPDTYHPARDVAKQQDWEWAIDRLARKLDISNVQRSAAYKFYDAKMTIEGDIAPDPRGMRGSSETWLERAARIYWDAQSYVFGHPDLTPMRQATFLCLFRYDQPTLETVRAARVGKGKGRTNQREAIDRIRWCAEVLANHFDGAGYEEARVNEKQIGVGEGWERTSYLPGEQARCVQALEEQGLQVFVSPHGSVFFRRPHAASVFQPLDTTPQIAASKT